MPRTPKQPVEQTKALQPTQKITKRGFAAYQRKQYLDNVPALCNSFFANLISKMNDGNVKALELGAEILRFKESKGISVVTNILQNNQNDGPARFSFEKLVRELEARDKPSVLEIQAD